MKCIYCNSDQQLTVSDIITFAITGAKLTKSFVCKKHNAFTNEKYEKQFVEDLDCFRNYLGLTTRDGKPIKYSADIIVDGVEMHDVKMSTNEALFAPKDVIIGFDKQGRKVILGTKEKIDRISNGKGQKVNINDITWRKTIDSDCFFGFNALHSIAKIAYEWYCYYNKIEEYMVENNEIVRYILNEIDGNYVDIIIDDAYYSQIDRIPDIGTNSIFQYDDNDGFRYVVFNLWKVIAYRVRICKSPDTNSQIVIPIMLNLPEKQISAYMVTNTMFNYCIDGTKKQNTIMVISPNRLPGILTIKAQDLNHEVAKKLYSRIEKIFTTIPFSICNLKAEIDTLSDNLKKYDEGKMDFIQLLKYQEYRTVFTVEIISRLYDKKEKYDMTKSFIDNFNTIMGGKIIIDRTIEEKKQFEKELKTKDKNGELSSYLRDRIQFFYKIFQNNVKLSRKV